MLLFFFLRGEGGGAGGGAKAIWRIARTSEKILATPLHYEPLAGTHSHCKFLPTFVLTSRFKPFTILLLTLTSPSLLSSALSSSLKVHIRND